MEEPPPAAGDLICGTCGAGNVPTRKFCRRCGASLADAPVQPSPSWWQRLLHRAPRQPHAAGYRPPVRRRWSARPVVWLVVVGLLGGAAWLFRSEVGGVVQTVYHAVRDRIEGNTEFNPVRMAASSEAPDHPAAAAHDGTTNVYWAPAVAGEGIGEFVEAQFDTPFRLTRVLVQPGASDNKQEYLAEASPRQVTVTATSADGSQVTREVTLADDPRLQNFEISASDVVAVRFTIVSAYRVTPEAHVAIAEVEFRGRQ